MVLKSRRPGDPRDLGDDHAVDVATLDVLHEFPVPRPVGVRSRLLVDVRLGRRKRVPESLGSVVARQLALAIEVLVLGTYATVERDALVLGGRLCFRVVRGSSFTLSFGRHASSPSHPRADRCAGLPDRRITSEHPWLAHKVRGF